ncbi:CASP8-associated protein 2 [Parambassis ranga]|uniref:CASP8-associated protein 2 n=1 Tax=Parambassis ranga TaxID=210632 RepID=A0A6P7HYI9_9TELE|nr:CASP8-associated protein 2 [Parambassis ranga]
MEDIDANDASGLLVPDGTNEDSVDIYDGLDVGFSSGAAKSPPVGSQLTESMDLYEDIVTEEHQSKQSSYNELQARFQAAQNQIKELRRRLEQMEMQNTGLSSENCCLKKNISALLRTARQEVARKDAEIQRLNQRSIKGPHHSHINNPNSSSRNPTSSRPPPPPPLSSLPHPPPPPPTPHPPASPPRGDQLPRDPPHPPKGSSHSNSKRDNEVGEKRTESDKYKSKHREEKRQSSSESMDRRHRSPNRGSHAHEKNRSHRADKDNERRYDSGSHKSRRHHRSDGAKTSSPDILHSAASSDDKKGSSRERRQDKSKISDSEHSCAKDSNTHRDRKIKTSNGHSRSSNSKDRKQSSDDRHRDSSREMDGHRQKDHHRTVERRPEGENSRKHKRTSESEMSKEEKKPRSKESDLVKPDDCSKERQDKTPKDLQRPSKEPNVVQRNSVEENSPNRKLCFMETLNLTLSPIKKPVLPMDGSQNDLTPVDKDVENSPDEDKSQPNMEDMCVIDETDHSELEAAAEDVAEESPHNLKASSSEQPDVTDVQEKDKSETVQNSVQSTSAQCQPLNNAENQMLPGESSSLPAVDSSRNHKDKPSLVSTSQVAECEPLEVPHSPRPGNTSGSFPEQDSSKDGPENNTAAVTEASVPNTSVGPLTDDVPPQPKEVDVSEDVAEKVNQQIPPTALPQVCPPASSTSCCDTQDSPKGFDTVSSTISLESVPKEGLSLKEAIYVLTQSNEDSSDGGSSITAEPGSSTGCIGVSKVSSTTEDKTLPERYSDLTVTPKKRATPVKRHENHQLGSSPLLHDEDSMMRTLSNLKKIPDVISPLRSPVRITKRGLLHAHGKPGHVKSLQKEFSSTAVGADSRKLDINKENKYPLSPAKSDAQNMVDNVPSSLSETDLEEGEILSESDEAAAGSPAPATKRPKLTPPVRNKASPKSVSLSSKRKCEERLVAPKETAGVSTRSPKSRFKTVCPAASKASFSTIEEIMETFKLVRAEIRKKYMKLHKTFPKKSFYGVMDNFQESFLEFVDGANFGQICSQVGELKSKLRKLISSVFSKVSNNGIVKRIFEQQAVDLKQKLWDFVDAQINYLFRDIHATLKGLCKTARPRDRTSSGDENISKRSSPKKDPPASLNRTMSCPVVPYKTGLGSRGKDIRITNVEKDRTADSHPASTPTVVEFLPPKNPPSTPEKNGISSLVVSQNGSLLDKTDFELLTEQQASSLTFTLVRDSQMGEIFKCLLQGSDLLENSGITGDNTAWSLSTPRKDGERFISITTPSKFDSPSKLLSPNKFDTPSKLIATWSSISPRKMSSPRQKDRVPLNPDLFDESCLLEVPSESRAGLPSQKSYSILAEDLAVSLTIPSPLKSDSHLSFLQPSSMSMHIMSTPDSVISAHISEDALLDGEDATEQDIHLALDTDNSSCCSTNSSSVPSEPLATPFIFKPDVPMQALVMEKSNDHFIVKIRQASTSADVTLTADETLTEEDQQHGEDTAAQDSQGNKSVTETNQRDAVPAENNLSNLPKPEVCPLVSESDTHLLTLKPSPSHKKEVTSPQHSTSKGSKKSPNHPHSDKSMKDGSESSDCSTATCQIKKHATPQKSPSNSPCESRKRTSPHKPATHHQSQTPQSHVSDSDRDERDESEKSSTITEETSSSPEKEQRSSGRKRKKQQRKSTVKRSRKEEEESRQDPVMKEDEDSNSLSPSSLSAKNLVKKKGEVVIAWTRDEDRAILIELKTKGASRETFSALSEKLDKPPAQIAHRFQQLIKLFKKQEKMDP